MCDCNRNKIGKMNGKQFTKTLTTVALTTAGIAVGAKVTALIPASIDSRLVAGGKLVGGILLATMSKGKSADLLAPLGAGIAINGAAGLINSFSPGLVSIAGVRGFDNRAYALRGRSRVRGMDNSAPGLAGNFSQPAAAFPGTVASML